MSDQSEQPLDLEFREVEVPVRETFESRWFEPHFNSGTLRRIKDLTDDQIAAQIQISTLGTTYHALLLEQGFRRGLEFTRRMLAGEQP